MPKKGKPREPPVGLRLVLSQNLKALLAYAEECGGEMADCSTYEGLAAYIAEHESGGTIGKSTIGRIATGDTDPSVDNLRLIAQAFKGIEAWHLLYPGLDPRDPPIVIDDRTRSVLRSLTDARPKFQAGEAVSVILEKESRGQARDDYDHPATTDGARHGQQPVEAMRRARAPRRPRRKRARGKTPRYEG